jgi:hypothetical protein
MFKAAAPENLTRIRPDSHWRTHQSKQSQMKKKLLIWTKTLQLSGNNKSNKHRLHNKISTTGEIAQEAKVSQDPTSITIRMSISQEQMLLETVNSVSTAKF